MTSSAPLPLLQQLPGLGDSLECACATLWKGTADNLKTFFFLLCIDPFLLYFPPPPSRGERERVCVRVCVGGSTRLPTQQQTCSRHCSVHEPKRPPCRVSSFYFFWFVCVCVCDFFFLFSSVRHQLTREGTLLNSHLCLLFSWLLL